ncbi:histidine kinase [Flavobacterium crassostreae]|uniref:Histidine kinase n=1 Tax=Flavobacterium crassostreae TaxID=1763534 RepID=A0A1B9E9V8_9FLAO|nr:histidine kinase [Flavobacterium crassostreae]OCB78723.1 histidine kinase [Flavobacterium crassostreae]
MYTQKLIKELPRALFISTTIAIFLSLLPLLHADNSSFDNQFKVRFLYALSYSFILYYANAMLFLFLNSFFEEQKYPFKRVLIGFLSSFILSLVVFFSLRILEEVILRQGTLEAFLDTESVSNYTTTLGITFLVLLGIYGLYFYKAYTDHKITEQQIIAGTASAKFESLKNQIDPHFLFNSLNVLSSLIEENPENAQRFTTSLSKIYRYVLEQKDKDLVPLEEELAFAKTYMNLLTMRFENSLFYELPTTITNPEAKVLPLSLQLLLENTVKHNVVSQKRPLHIRIYIQEDYLVVQNDLQKKEVLSNRQGVGLQNIISRYALVTNKKVKLEQSQQLFTVQLPILTKQISTMFVEPHNQQDQAYGKAQETVTALKNFYQSLLTYGIVVPILIVINLRFSPQFQWFWFPAAGWGLGLLLRALQVFGYNSNWEHKKTQRILEQQPTKTKSK